MAHRIQRSARSVDRVSRRCADALARGRSCLLLLEFQGAPLLHLALSRHLRERGLPLAPHAVFLSFVVSCVRTETRSESRFNRFACHWNVHTFSTSASDGGTQSWSCNRLRSPSKLLASRAWRVGVLRPQAGTLCRTSPRTLHPHRSSCSAHSLRWLALPTSRGYAG